jgi:hypothetical protein
MVSLRGISLRFVKSTKEASSMCDYSLHLVATRPAKVGDRLVSTRFANSITRGFAEVGEPAVAVCLAPGTELAFERDIECDAVLPFLPSKKLRQRVACFRYAENRFADAHRDALEFPNGKMVLLTRLCEGQHATVLQLPANPQEERAHEATHETPQRRHSGVRSTPAGAA